MDQAKTAYFVNNEAYRRRPPAPKRSGGANIGWGDVMTAEFDNRLYLDFEVELRKEPGNRAWFGRNVLDGLIEGVDDFVHERQTRWERRTYRVGAPVLIGCSPWVNDDKLLSVIQSLAGACIMVAKHPRTGGGKAGAERLREINRRTPGIELRALSGLSDMAPKVGGRPQVIGPYDSIHEEGASVSTFRTIGFRKSGRDLPPIAHAKVALLGNICWTDEHPAGVVDDYVWFRARRLWVSSANFTYGSRKSLEFGYWTEDEDLVQAFERFLIGMLGASEDLDSDSDAVDPEMARIEFDDVAMAEAMAEQEQAREEMAALAGEDPEDPEDPEDYEPS
jgi:hypothetical protein